MQRTLRDLHMQLHRDAFCELQIESLEALQGHCHIQWGLAFLKLRGDDCDLINCQEMRGCSLTEKRGLNAFNQTRFCQRF